MKRLVLKNFKNNDLTVALLYNAFIKKNIKINGISVENDTDLDIDALKLTVNKIYDYYKIFNSEMKELNLDLMTVDRYREIWSKTCELNKLNVEDIATDVIIFLVLNEFRIPVYLNNNNIPDRHDFTIFDCNELDDSEFSFENAKKINDIVNELNGD